MTQTSDSLHEKMMRLEAEAKRLRKALQEIHDDCGHVCKEFELCKHVACTSSYAAWAIADAALKKEG